MSTITLTPLALPFALCPSRCPTNRFANPLPPKSGLILAAETGSAEAVAAVLALGGDVLDQADDMGYTSFHAVRRRWIRRLRNSWRTAGGVGWRDQGVESRGEREWRKGEESGGTAKAKFACEESKEYTG